MAVPQIIRSTALKNAVCDAECAYANGGKLQGYTGPMPAAPETALTTQVKCVEWALSAPAYGAAAAGVAAMNPPAAAPVLAAGLVTWYRVVDSGGTPLWIGTVGNLAAGDSAANFNVVLGNALLQLGTSVTIGAGAATHTAL